MGDWIGRIRLRVDRSKPLSECVEAVLDTRDLADSTETLAAVADVHLWGKEFALVFANGTTFSLPVSECII